jgi:hypothetical protein
MLALKADGDGRNDEFGGSGPGGEAQLTLIEGDIVSEVTDQIGLFVLRSAGVLIDHSPVFGEDDTLAVLFDQFCMELSFQLSNVLMDSRLREREGGSSFCVALMFRNGEKALQAL